MQTGIALLTGLGLCVIVTELVAQVFYVVVVKKQFDAVKNSAYFYLQKSANPVLGYELKPGINLVKDNRLLIINRLGVREASESTRKRKHRIGLLGDSVVFGINQSQDSTLSELLEDCRHDSIDVINLGVPGYATGQMAVQYGKFQSIYHVDQVIYLLNLNDFTVRNTIYEGADNGVYRYFNSPIFKSLWFLRKLIYRIRKKGEITFNTDYYRWAYQGTRNEIFDNLIELKNKIGPKLSVVILPSGVAYQHGHYELGDITTEIDQFLTKQGIRCVNPVHEFSQNTMTLFDETDHLTIKGNKRMAQTMVTTLIR